MKQRVIKVIFFAIIVKPIIFIILGLSIKNRQNLPFEKGSIIAPNHNSHLDTLVIMSLYPLSKIHKIRPVAAADYFLKNKFIAWIALNCIGIIPFDRKGSSANANELFKDIYKALDEDDILILFPEGSRGKPEEISRIKKGLYYIVKDRDDTKVTPIYLEGLGKSLPKGEALFVPFNCRICVGKPLLPSTSSKEFNEQLINFFKEQNIEKNDKI